jgi:hypothetical protein
MGVSGSIYWFTERRDLVLEDTTRALLDLFGPVTGVHVVRFDSEDTSWARFQEEETNPTVPFATIPEMSSVASIDVCSTVEAAAMMLPGVFQSCEPRDEIDSRGIQDAIRRSIPEQFRGQCMLSAPYIGVGGCDIWDIPVTSESDEPVYYGRSQYYVMLQSHTTPTNVWEYEPRYLELPEVRRLQRDIEAILGPVKRCIIWST